VILAQCLAGLSIDEVQLSAGKTGNRLVLVFRNIWIAIQLVLQVRTGLGTSE
jgi:hypothetical protein